MEIHLLYIVWCTALVFTILSYYAKNNYTFPVIAGVAWILVSMGFAEVTYYGWTAAGTQLTRTVQAGDPNTTGMVGAIYFFGGIGLVMLLMTGAWLISGRKVGDDV